MLVEGKGRGLEGGTERTCLAPGPYTHTFTRLHGGL